MPEIASLTRARRVSSLSRQMAECARALTTASMTVELALARHDREGWDDATDVVLALADRLREQRRGLLAIGRPHQGDLDVRL